jgi:basic membrane protein A
MEGAIMKAVWRGPLRPTHALAAVLLGSLALGGCGGGPTPTPVVVKAYKVGLVTNGTLVNDGGYNQASYAAVQQAQTDLGVQPRLLEAHKPEDYAAMVGDLAAQKYDLIITLGPAQAEITAAAAKANPDLKFIGVDQSPRVGHQNLATLVFAEDKAGYLAGALAAKLSQRKQIGAVLGTDASPVVWRYGEGFRAGAAALDPAVTAQVVYHNDVAFSKTFDDPAWGKITAQGLIDKGADVLFGAGGATGTGALLAAADHPGEVLAIGVDVDQYTTVPQAQFVIVSSAMKQITPGLFKLIKQAKTGGFQGGTTYGDVGLAPYHNLAGKVPAAVTARMSQIAADLNSDALKTNVPPARP